MADLAAEEVYMCHREVLAVQAIHQILLHRKATMVVVLLVARLRRLGLLLVVVAQVVPVATQLAEETLLLAVMVRLHP
jgi:hypothetical protein